RIRIDEPRREGDPVVAAPVAGRHEHARREAHDVPRARGERALVEVVEIEVLDAIRALERAEVLEMEVAAAPRGGRGIERRAAGPVLPEEVAGAAKKPGARRAHALVLATEAFQTSSGVEAVDAPGNRVVRNSRSRTGTGRGDGSQRRRGHLS